MSSSLADGHSIAPRAPGPVMLGLGIVGVLAGVLAVASGRPDVALVAITLGLIPVLHVVGVHRPDVLVGLFVLAQPLEAFEVPTPFTTVSVGNALLVVLLLSNYSSLPSILRASRVAQIAAAILVAWLLMYPLRAVHDPIGQVMRTAVTMASFAVVAAVGVAVAPHARVLRAIALGAFGALMFLAAAGVLVNMGLAPMTERFEPPRNLLGFTSPLMRTYGLDVPVDAVSLLVPLCVPFLSVLALDRGSNPSSRMLSILGVSLVALASLMVFQGRGMLLQIAIAVALAGLLAVPRRYRTRLLAGMGSVLLLVALQLVLTDTKSTVLRGGINLLVIESVLADPLRFLLGVPEAEFYLDAARRIGLEEYVPAGTVVHNFFLSTLVGGGLISFALIVAFHALALWASIRRWRVAPTIDSRTMLVAAIVVIVGLSFEPARAGIVGSWLLLGIAIGRTPRSIRS